MKKWCVVFSTFNTNILNERLRRREECGRNRIKDKTLMAYDEKLAKRLSKLIARRNDFYEQKMFGGLGFILRGNMCFGIWKESLILRLGESQAQNALKIKNVKPFDITGRAMKGWVMVAPSVIKTDAILRQWVERAIDFVIQLPRK